MNPVIAQSDVVTAYGWGIDALWEGLLEGKTAIHSSDRFAGRGFVSNQAAIISDLEVPPGISRGRAMLTRLLSPLAGKLDPQTPLILATTVGEIEFIERAVLENATEYAAGARPVELLAHVKHLLGLRGPGKVVSSACASSAAALARAVSMVRRGEAPAVLVVACDAISEFVYSGFSTLLSLCDVPAKPFDAERSGLSLGEAAAWALVTADDSPLATAESTAILGSASTTDAIHMTAPDRNAGGLSRAIDGACKMAGTDPTDIAVVAAHGTATIYSDAMEMVAFRGAIPEPVPIFSVKGGTGHTLAAAGLVQILVAARALSRGVAPPTVGMSVPDANAVGWVHNAPVELHSPRFALSVNSGFGGVNTAVVLGRSSGKNVPKTATPKVGTAIHAVAWFCADHYVTLVPGKPPFRATAPPSTASDAMLELIGRPVKYFSRMTAECRSSLAAASLALRAAGWDVNPPRRIGLLADGYDGCIKADHDYFRDYVAAGRSMGRGNLFIYTLPTSTLGEIAIALSLCGPTLHIGAEGHPVAGLVREAEHLLADQEADGMLALWSELNGAICVAIGRADGTASPATINMTQILAAMWKKS